MQELNNLPLHHIGFAVRSLSETQPAFEALGANFVHESTDEQRNLDFRFAQLGGVLIELISPHDAELPSAVTRMVKNDSCTMYHLCLKTDNLEAELKRLKSCGFKQMCKVYSSNVYGYNADGTFLFHKSLGLLKLIQEQKTHE